MLIKFFEESPTITESKKEELKKGEVGGEIVIECPVKGYPPPTIVWAKNGLPLQTSSTV